MNQALLWASAMLLASMQMAGAESCTTSRVTNCFTGQLALDDNPADSSGKTKKLRSNFGFVDRNGVGWQTNGGDITNGASIPTLLQPIVGEAFEEMFISAAVIHDRYCDEQNRRRVRPWRQTHRMFYEALRLSGVSAPRAKVMYYAVYTFGPRWGYLNISQPCDITMNCVQVEEQNWSESLREDTYDDPLAQAELQLVQARIEALSAEAEELTLEELEAISDGLHKGDEYLRALAEPPLSELQVE